MRYLYNDCIQFFINANWKNREETFSLSHQISVYFYTNYYIYVRIYMARNQILMRISIHIDNCAKSAKSQWGKVWFWQVDFIYSSIRFLLCIRILYEQISLKHDNGRITRCMWLTIKWLLKYCAELRWIQYSYRYYSHICSRSCWTRTYIWMNRESHKTQLTKYWIFFHLIWWQYQLQSTRYCIQNVKRYLYSCDGIWMTGYWCWRWRISRCFTDTCQMKFSGDHTEINARKWSVSHCQPSSMTCFGYSFPKK